MDVSYLEQKLKSFLKMLIECMILPSSTVVKFEHVHMVRISIEATTDMRCHLILMVTVWTVLTLAKVDVSHLEAQNAQSNYSLTHQIRPWWKSALFHVLTCFGEVTTDIRCHVIYMVTMWQALYTVCFHICLHLLTSLMYGIRLWYKTKSTLFRIVQISMRWQRIYAVTSSTWLPCEK